MLFLQQRWAGAFTRRNVRRYPIVPQGTIISCKPYCTYIEVTLDETLCWNPHIKQVKKKLLTIVNIIRFVSGTRCGPTVPSRTQLHNALSVSSLCYSLQAVHGPCRTNLRILESLQAQALRVCLGFSAGTVNVGTVAEARPVLPGIMRCQGTILAHLRYQTRNMCHYLSKLCSSKPSSDAISY